MLVGDAVFVRENAIYDAMGMLHADIDTISGGFIQGRVDPVSYKGQIGQYTDIETLHLVNGFYTALSGPGGIYYNPESGVGMARHEATIANDYAGLTEFGLTSEETAEFNASLPKAKQAFDDLSLIPGANIPFTLCSSGVSAYQGKWAEATQNLVGLIPDAGGIVKGLKYAREAEEFTKDAEPLAKDVTSGSRWRIPSPSPKMQRGMAAGPRGSWRKQTLEDALKNAPEDAEGNKICPTCGEPFPATITEDTINGPKVRRGYDVDHYPEPWNERRKVWGPRPIRGKPWQDEFNRDIRAQCPPCNQGRKFEGKPGEFESP